MKNKVLYDEIVTSNLTKNTWVAIYRFLDKLSPIPFDCGSLCGAICCNPEDFLTDEDNLKEEEIGIYLMPGEEKLHSLNDDWITWSFEDAKDYFPSSWNGKVAFIKCKSPSKCERKKRPLQCRTFPLYPFIDRDDKLSLIYFPHETPYNCPLIYNRVELNESFKKGTYTVWKRLIKERKIFDLIKEESNELFENEVIKVYP